MIKKGNVSEIDTMVLSYGQLLQPADADQIYDFSKGTLVAESLTASDFRSHFKRLEREASSGGRLTINTWLRQRATPWH